MIVPKFGMINNYRALTYERILNHKKITEEEKTETTHNTDNLQQSY